MGVLALFTAGVAEAQSRRITGKVTADGTNEPISNATVNVLGTTLGAYTNEQGVFTIVTPAGSQNISVRVRRIGYVAKVVPVSAAQNEISISLVKDVLQLEAQVVTGTATTVSTANAANAVTVVSGEQLTRVSAPTIDNALQGKVAGAIISTNSGAPGGGTQVQLRGVSTILGNYTPLYVVDGVIVNNATIPSGLNVVSGSARGNFSSSQDQSVNRIADLNPNDIEDIQILKGPSASSIYGSKGTNGVIIITTKRGVAGKTNVDFTQRVGRSTLANKLGERCFTSSSEYADWASINLGQAKSEAAAEYTAATVKCHDYEEEYYANDGVAYETIGSIRGGSQGSSYFVSGLAKHDNGLAPNDFYNKQSLRANVGQVIGSRLTLNANTEILHTLTQRGISGNDNYGVSPIGVFAFTPSIYQLNRNADGTFPQNGSQINGPSNPFQNADQVKTPNNTYRFIGSVSSNLSVYSSERQTLDATVTAGVDTYKSVDRVVSPATNYADAATNGALAGTLYNSDGNFTNANLNASLVHRMVLSALTGQTSAGMRQERRESEISALTGRGVIFPSVTNVSAAAQTFPNQTLGLAKDFGYFAQEEVFAFNERLLLTAGINSERSSTNGNQTKFYTYPKYSASYRVTSYLPAMVNDLKIRAAYGKAGNLPTAGRQTFLTSLLYEGGSGTRASTTIGAPEIHPELATETEGGFDLTLFNSRVRLSATSYKKKITDLLLTAPIVQSTGFTTQYLNGGQITNHGQELELDVTAYQRGNTSWISTTSFSRQRGFVDELPNGVLPFIPPSGSFGSRYGNAWIAPGQSTTVIQSVVGCRVAVTPGATCASANRITGFAADANPDYNVGFNNQINVGKFRASGLLEWRKGGAGVNLTNNYCDSYNLCADTLASLNRNIAFGAGNPVYVENTGFVKLREITVGYELPTTLTKGVFGGRAQNVRLELSGRNLKTWTKYTGLDPEVSNFGNQAIGRFQDVTPYPPSRTFLFSLVTSF